MKLKRILSHPYALLISFLLVVTSIQPIVEFYCIYLFTGLFCGNLYSIAGTLGIIIILYSHFRYSREKFSLDACFINLVGAVLMIVSLFLFFLIHHYDVIIPGDLSHLFPFTSLLLFCILVTCFITVLPQS